MALDGGSAIPRGGDDRLHVVEIGLQRPSTAGGQLVVGPRDPTVERLVAQEIARVLQPPRVQIRIRNKTKISLRWANGSCLIRIQPGIIGGVRLAPLHL